MWKVCALSEFFLFLFVSEKLLVSLFTDKRRLVDINIEDTSLLWQRNYYVSTYKEIHRTYPFYFLGGKARTSYNICLEIEMLGEVELPI